MKSKNKFDHEQESNQETVIEQEAPFRIGQEFDNIYPPDAAIWCNENNAHIDVVEGKYIIVENPPPPEPTYAESRLREYPSINDQMDMLYHDQLNGTTTWRDTIAAVKEKYPKQ